MRPRCIFPWGRQFVIEPPPPVSPMPPLPPMPQLVVGPCICPHCGHDVNKRASV